MNIEKVLEVLSLDNRYRVDDEDESSSFWDDIEELEVRTVLSRPSGDDYIIAVSSNIGFFLVYVDEHRLSFITYLDESQIGDIDPKTLKEELEDYCSQAELSSFFFLS